MTVEELFDYLYAHIGRALPRPEMYAQWEQVRRNMRIHSRGENPREVIIKRHPREDEESFAWRMANYVAITEAPYMRAQSSLTRILNDSGYSIKVSEELIKILSNKWYFGMDFYNFFQKSVLYIMLEDPNGFLVWLPESREDGAFRIKPMYVSSANVYYYDEKYLVFLSEKEHSEVYYSNRTEKTGEVYYVLTPNITYQVYQVGRKSDRNFETRIYYEKYEVLFDEIPAIKFGGIYISEGFFKSFFAPFVGWANEALRQFSDWQVVMATSAYPIKEIAALLCEVCNGKGEYYDNKKACNCACVACDGKGHQYRMGPFNSIMRKEVNVNLGEKEDTRPLMSYITPPVDIIKYAQESWQDLIKRAEDALHLNFTLESQSGVAKTVDREELYAMLANISTNVYDNLMWQSLVILEKYYSDGAYEEPVVTKPTSFQVKTESELREDYQMFVKDGNAKNISLAILLELCDKKFTGSIDEKKKTQVLSQYDPLYLLSEAEKSNEAVLESFVKADFIRSAHATWALENIIEQKGSEWFKQADIETIKRAIEDIISPLLVDETEIGSDRMEADLNEELEDELD